jgi:hypothetical protein
MAVVLNADLTRILALVAQNTFTGVDFHSFKESVEFFTSQLGLSPIVRAATDIPHTPAQLAILKRIILTGLSANIRAAYTQYADPITIWRLLEVTYNSCTPTAISELRTTFSEMKYDESKETVKEFIQRFRSNIAALFHKGVTINGDESIHQLFRALPQEFLMIKQQCEIAQITDFEVYALRVGDYSLSRKILEQANSVSQFKDNSNTNRTRSSGRRNQFSSNNSANTKSRLCWNCGDSSHISPDCSKPKAKCSVCNISGHLGEYCRRKKPVVDISAMVAEAVKVALASFQNTNANNKNNNNHSAYHVQEMRALLDSGATRHLIKDKSIISNMHQLSTPISMMVANQEVVTIDQGGEIMVGTSGESVVLDVAYAPTFQENLISIGQLTDDGVLVSFDNQQATVDFGVGVLIAPKQNNLFVITQHGSSALSVTDPVQDFVFHYRMGHISTATSKLMVDAVLDGDCKLMSTIVDSCVTCAKAKGTRSPFSKTTSALAPTSPLGLVVADLCGPIQHYYISELIDVFSRYISVDIIHRKSEAIRHIINWLRQAQTQHGSVLKHFHSDGGGEYRSTELLSFFSNQGTKVTTTTAGTPQHNGMAERSNRTILNMVRALLFHAKLLPALFWKYAVHTAVYIINRCVPSSLKSQGKTRYELYHGSKPSIAHMRVFGCDVQRQLPPNSRNDKLSEVSLPGIFVGYDNDTVGYYNIWDISQQKVIRSRDVTFFENSFTNGRSKMFIQQQQQHQNNVDFSQLFDTLFDNIQDQSPAEIQEDIQQPIQYQNSEFCHEDKQEEVEEDEKEQSGYSLDNNFFASLPTPAEEEFSLPSTVHTPAVTTLTRVDASNIISGRTRASSHAHLVTDVPSHYYAAMKCPAAPHWKKAADAEMASHEENNTWCLTPLPRGCKAIDCMWVFTYKFDSDGNIIRHKARLVAKGFQQREGIDYILTFAPVLKYKSLLIILALTVQLMLELVQMDVVTAFLNADIKEEVYMKQPQGYQQGDNDLVCKLNKTIYGLRQAPHDWYELFSKFLISIGFTQLSSDNCVFVKIAKSGLPIIVGVFVDDSPAAYAKQDEQEWLEVKAQLMSRFKMKDLGECKFILGMRVTRDRDANSIVVDSQIHIDKMLLQFGMSDCKSAPTPATLDKLIPTTSEEEGLIDVTLFQSMVGALNYLAHSTRPDISHAVNGVARFASKPSPHHVTAVKRIFRYLAGTSKLGLVYTRDPNESSVSINSWADADWAGDTGDRKSTTGYVVKIGNNTVSWATKKQTTVALSTAEAEYMAIAAVLQEVIWIKSILCEILGQNSVSQTPTVYTDNQAARSISRDDAFHQRTKHIDIKHHFIRQHVRDGTALVIWTPSNKQTADILTKPLGSVKFLLFQQALLNSTFEYIQ